MSKDMTRMHATLSGRVPGVFFRAETRAKARRNGVLGRVGNTPDGWAETVFEGRAQDVDQRVQWCRGGPPNARVEDSDLDEEPYTGVFESFWIRR
jgi:acylphosphatase